ncbi:Asp-tRNA(Asn)/Glu-tRNA(Gln) amidotransferase subunit GatA [Limisphaera ngatamarikiensis]|uniref:Glutamyl-tRNA(Gln) amidotransferase subunit A n=1 Tax=Limisphaera ngatamarikiensis TaxID=1324935 RepID=A0A6M1RRE4_9BACT|nr:Asp-tRNA(Asn)/Glu-tRNA(Gln) amidotransferase subunit GatA [Limisphaera ngatamarikiensis]NGO39967.1 Asp-tRNA(Asn)/Glu-tRNA(Gln) amidotransferase subunit GatA [Limisphaera ngatamarikiensis]
MNERLTLKRCQELLRRREVSARDLTQHFLRRIERLEPSVHSFLEWDAADALAQAETADRALADGATHQKQPLLGIPVAIKDNIAVKGQPLRCASRILGDFRSPYDATVVERLRQAGAILLGRLNMDEFAMGSSTENSAFGPTRNPWDLDRTPGGSSGGSAAAVAAEEVPAALGSDTGGSIRQPAAFCGCVGLKPTYGRVSRYGLVAFASSLDQIGPLTATVEDAALLLGVIAGHDPRDATSLPDPALDPDLEGEPGLRGIRLGLPREYFGSGLAPEVEQAVHSAIRHLEGLGAEIREVSLPHTPYALATYYVIATAEASANLARFDGIRYGLRVDGQDPIELYKRTRGRGFGPEVKRRIILGTFVLSSGYYDAYYLRAQKVRTLIRNDFLDAFRRVDLLVTPVTPTPAFRLGEKVSDPLQMYLSDVFTLSCNLAGICGISVPCGFTESPRLPIGLQLLGPPLGEATLLRVAHAYQQTTNWHKERSPLALA